MKRLAVGGCALLCWLGPIHFCGLQRHWIAAIVSVAPAPRILSGATRSGPCPPRRPRRARSSCDRATTPRSSSSSARSPIPVPAVPPVPGGGRVRDPVRSPQATIEAVRSQLAADGLHVTGVARWAARELHGDRQRVETRLPHRPRALPAGRRIDGPGDDVRRRVPVDDRRLGRGGRRPERPGRAPRRDRIVAPRRRRAARTPRPRPRQFAHPPGSPTACADAQADAQQFGGLTDDQIADAYGAFGLYGSGDLGAGQHIAIYELEPFAALGRQDVRHVLLRRQPRRRRCSSRLHVIPVDGGQPAGPGSGEAILDVEDVSAMAPGATIDVYEAPSTATTATTTRVDEYAAIVDADRDQIISTSWGLCEQAIQLGQPGLQQAENLLFEQAAAQGQSVFGAAGDNGSDDCNTFETPTPVAGQNPLSVDDPASQPYVVSVGGTTIDDATQPPAEHVWNDGADWRRRRWRDLAVVDDAGLAADATRAGDRAAGQRRLHEGQRVEQQLRLPDRLLPGVRARRDRARRRAAWCPTSRRRRTSSPARSPSISQREFEGRDGWTTIGGTSSSTPIWAAMLALVNASPTCAANASTANGVGFVSPLLYAVASNPTAYAASFNDITAGNNDIYGLDNGLVFPATTGYDLAIGPGLAAADRPGRHRRAGLLPVQLRAATRRAGRSSPA